jgi:ribonuclease HI
MELEAAIAALGYLAGRYGACAVELYTDSTYLRQGITEWIDDWFARGWVTKGNVAVKNQDLWHKLYDLTHTHQVQWQWIKGHAGDRHNERVDLLARQARARLSEAAAEPPAPLPLPAPIAAQDSATDGNTCHAQIAVGVSCQGGGGPCGWAAVLRCGEERHVLSGRDPEATSNSLLLQAAAQGLQALDRPCQVTVYTDSDYLGRGAGEWVGEWQRHQWQTRTGRPVKNREQWEALLQALQRHEVSWQVVRDEPLPADLREAKGIAVQESATGRL